MATLAEATTQLANWEAASAALATSASYSLPDGRTLTRADGQTIQNQIRFWSREVQVHQRLAAGASDGRHRVARFV